MFLLRFKQVIIALGLFSLIYGLGGFRLGSPYDGNTYAFFISLGGTIVIIYLWNKFSKKFDL